MARKSKILCEEGVDKRQVGYFPTPDFVSQYLFEEMMLLNPDGSKVLDPAVGKGELIKSFLDCGKEVEGYDIINFPDRPERIKFRNYILYTPKILFSFKRTKSLLFWCNH